VTDMTKDAATSLRKPFPAASIGKLPKGGAMLDYVGHAAVTDRLLTVDPNWSWEPFAIGPDGLPALDAGRNLWIRLTICGVTRIGVGDGKSAKECIGDAIRNAAMRFGVALDLWAKEDLVEFAQAANKPTPVSFATPPSGELMTARSRGEMFALFGQKRPQDDAAAQLGAIAVLTGVKYESRADITEDHALHVIGALRKLPDAPKSEGCEPA
jgi:hypothetical protein